MIPLNRRMTMTMTNFDPRSTWRARLGILGMALVLAGPAIAADFTVTTPNAQFAFNINGVNQPALTLVRGQTYTFDVSTTAGFHPFRINAPGVSNNGITSGTLTFAVPATAASYTYLCDVHGLSMGGTINTIAPAAPPTITLTSITVNDDIVLTSTGTNTWTVLPEFTTNVASTNWFALTVQTNRFANGTNETICGRPEAANVFIRIRSEPADSQ